MNPSGTSQCLNSKNQHSRSLGNTSLNSMSPGGSHLAMLWTRERNLMGSLVEAAGSLFKQRRSTCWGSCLA